MNDPEPSDRRVDRPLARALFLGPYLALTGLQWVWHGLLFPAPPIVVAVALLPLLAPLPWLLRGEAPRARVLATYLSLVYFVHGVTEALVSAPARALALTETALCVSLYVLAVLLKSRPDQ